MKLKLVDARRLFEGGVYLSKMGKLGSVPVLRTPRLECLWHGNNDSGDGGGHDMVRSGNDESGDHDMVMMTVVMVVVMI
jgi:hypothetical protein